MQTLPILAVTSLAMGILVSSPAQAQTRDAFRVQGTSVQAQANGVLSLMSFSAVPDLTTSDLSITNAASGNPGLWMTQFGGGFTLGPETPLYLEGSLGLSRYDPTYVASNGRETATLPVRWTSLAGTGGVGWDFPLTDELKLRPIFNVTLGYVASDLAVGRWYVREKTGIDLAFLDHGSLQAGGLGASLMLDYEHYRDDGEVDVELRYTDIRLHSLAGSEAVQGSAKAQTASAWARWRAPTGLTALQRPLRYVLEGAHSVYLGSQTGLLGFDHLSSVGAGIELDSSAHEVYVTRTRLVVRHVFGNGVAGTSMSLAMSF